MSRHNRARTSLLTCRFIKNRTGLLGMKGGLLLGFVEGRCGGLVGWDWYHVTNSRLKALGEWRCFCLVVWERGMGRRSGFAPREGVLRRVQSV